MTGKDDKAYLKHILECIDAIHDHCGHAPERLEEGGMAWDAVMRRLQIMAESTARLSDKAKQGMPEIAWSKIKSFRNVLVHDYLGDIDPIIVRKIIQDYLPPLRKACQHLLEQWEKTL